jgi:3-phosphoshikimate 1-carboxyvinyltransferase
MSKKWIKPSRINGRLTAPSSKSMTLRAIAAAALCDGVSWIKEPSWCDDAQAGFGIAEALGAHLDKSEQAVSIAGKAPLPKAVLNCRESGLCMRMFAPIAALSGETIVLTGSGSLIARPMDMMTKPLRQLGASCNTRDGFPPVEVRGPLKGGDVAIDGSTSSQFLTGLLCALPVCSRNSEIRAAGLKSKPYVTMTVDLLSRFGIAVELSRNLEEFFIKGGQRYKPTLYSVEGDWSGAAFLLTAGAIAGKVTLNNLQPGSLQPDQRILEVLRAVGAGVTVTDNSVTIEERSLKSFIFDASDSPDLFPPLVALACHCPGKTTIHGVNRLRHKESDRALALFSEFSAIGAKIRVDGDVMEIEGRRMRGGVLDSFGDHRIAMAGAVAALNTEEGVMISGWECVSKSYPGFFRDLEFLQESLT